MCCAPDDIGQRREFWASTPRLPPLGLCMPAVGSRELDTLDGGAELLDKAGQSFQVMGPNRIRSGHGHTPRVCLRAQLLLHVPHTCTPAAAVEGDVASR